MKTLSMASTLVLAALLVTAAGAATDHAPCKGVTMTQNNDGTWKVYANGRVYLAGADQTLESLTATYCEK